MRRLLANVLDNPILLRELRRRMRGKALIWSIISYIMLMTASTVLVLIFYSPPPNAPANTEMLRQLHETGSNIFFWITGIQALLVLIIAPTITAGMTTGEKERQTFDFLRVTTITRWMYVLGCFLSTAFYVGLALICALPLLSLAFLYGGVSLEDVIGTFFMLLAGSCVLSSFGLYISSVCERTRTAQGIIVFLIFALLFGLFLLASVLGSTFVGAAGGAAPPGGAAPGTVFVFNAAIPNWVFGVLVLLLLTQVFLLLAARKLFEPEESRAFSHWQFAVLLASWLFAGIGILSSNQFTNELMEVFFLAAGFLLLMAGMQTFSIGRMEVGDEIWHLKRVLPFLRPIDQTIPFLLGIGALWFFSLQFLADRVTLNMSAGLFNSFMITSVAAYAFFGAFGRSATGWTGSRRKAGLASLLLLGFLLLIFPLTVGVLSAVAPDAEELWRELLAFSPLALLYDGVNNTGAYDGPGPPVGSVAAVAMVVLAVLVGIPGEYARWRRWRNFDYHFDMPVG